MAGLRAARLLAAALAQPHPALVWLATGETLDARSRRLYGLLGAADMPGVDVVLAEVPDGDGPAEALRDLLRCAAGRGSVPTD
jgi:L-threonylcarbamoyladenylate synthase